MRSLVGGCEEKTLSGSPVAALSGFTMNIGAVALLAKLSGTCA